MTDSRAQSDATLPWLVPGDRVRLVSPASYPTDDAVASLCSTLSGWGLVPDVAPHVFDRRGYMAGRDDDRLGDLNDAICDPDVRAIVTTRGGAGCYRIADRIDVEAARRDPKPLLGFSDISYAHLTLLSNGCAGPLHGCLDGDIARASARQLLMTTDPLSVEADPTTVSGTISVPGTATGPVIGGNLAATATSVGVRLPPLDGAILFLEDQRLVGLGTIDRQLTQLIASGALDGVAGIVLGSFEEFRDYEDRCWTLVDVLNDRLGDLGVPVLGGIRSGHDLLEPDGRADQTCLPLGATAVLDTESRAITFEQVGRPTIVDGRSGQV